MIQQTRDGLESLARHTGRTLAEVVDLAQRDELRSLFDERTGRLRNDAEPSPLAVEQQHLARLGQLTVAAQRAALVDRAARWADE